MTTSHVAPPGGHQVLIVEGVTGRPSSGAVGAAPPLGGGEGEGRVAARSGEACLPRKQGI
jgi:hypothetical protein